MSYIVDFPSPEQIAFGLAPGFELIERSARHTGSDGNGIDSADSAQDMVSGITGLYAGFPATTAETFEVRSDNTGDDFGVGGAETVRLSYLPTSASTSYSTVDVNLDGTNWVSSGVTGIRLNDMVVIAGTDNIGKIEVRWVTSLNVFATIMPGRNRSKTCAYTVPAGRSALLIEPYLSISIGANGNGSANATLRVASVAGILVTERDVDITTGKIHDEPLIKPLSAGDDVIWRCESVSNNDTLVDAGFRIIERIL